MPVSRYKLVGFEDYEIWDKKMFRKAYSRVHSRYKMVFYAEREIKRTEKDGQTGYFLVRNGIRKFYSLKSHRHRLEKIE